MSLETQYSSGSFSRRIAELKSQSIVEIKFSGQDMGDVVAVYPKVSLSSCDTDSGRATFSGRLICTLIYLDGSGSLCRVQKGAEFSHFADDDRLAPMQQTVCRLSCDRSQVKRDGSSYVVSIVVGANIDVYASADRNMLLSCEGAIVQTENTKLYSAVKFSGESEVEDDFDCNAEDVLIPAAEVLVTDCNCRAGVIEITGEIYLSILAMREGKPVSLERIVPFKSEIASEESVLSRKAYCLAEIKDLSVTAQVNEEKGKCNVELIAALSFTGTYFEDEDFTIICDAFSPTCNVKLTSAEEQVQVLNDYKVFSERVHGVCAIKAKIDFGCNFLAAILPRAEYTQSGNSLEGCVTATLLYEQGDEMRSTEISLPFTVPMPSGCGNTNIAVCGLNLRQRTEGECDAEAVLKISACEEETSTARYITDLEEGEPKKVNDCALSVYIPCAGDSLWDTAKKLSQSPETIQSTNPELSFPLTGDERILVYRIKT